MTRGTFYDLFLAKVLHLQQVIILLTSLQWLWREREDYFCAGNLTIYYSPNQKKSEYLPRPDFFVVLDTTKDLTRKSWVVWEEDGKYPNVIIEILSDSTAQIDRGEKKRIYQNTFRTPDYFWFDPFTLEFECFTLISGKYEAIQPNEEGWLYSSQLGLYLGIFEDKLRYFTPDGELVLMADEEIIQQREEANLQERQQKELALQQMENERQQKEYECQQKELAQQRLEELTTRLRELGINPDEIN